MPLTQLELLALVSVARLGKEAYAVTIHEHIASLTGRDVSMAALYAALDRLERQALVEPWQSEPKPQRGGRSRRHFNLTDGGRATLRTERALADKMWRGMPLPADGRRR